MVSLRFVMLQALALPLPVHLASAWSLGRDKAPWSPNLSPRGEDGLETLARLQGRESSGCASRCSPGMPPLVQKRSLPGSEQMGQNISLWERAMKTPAEYQNSMDAFMVAEVPEANQLYSLTKLKNPNAARFRKFERHPFSYGMAGLRGCTSFVLVGQSAVYIAHWWESISFDPDDNEKLENEDSDATFKRTLIDGLIEGSGTQHPKLDANNFEDLDLKAYLIRPKKSCKDVDDGYRTYWDKIKETVDNLVPETKSIVWREVIYDALAVDKANDPHGFNSMKLHSTCAGRALFKFDPDHNGQGESRAVLWVQDQEIHSEKWTPKKRESESRPSSPRREAHGRIRSCKVWGIWLGG